MKTMNPLLFRLMCRATLVVVLSVACMPEIRAQAMEDKIQKLTQEVTDLSALILELRSEVAKSREELRDLRLEFQKSRDTQATGVAAVAAQDEPLEVTGEPKAGPEQRLTQLEENQRLLSGRLEEQYQTKVESASRYRTKLTGVVLLNAFHNDARVESAELPGLALRSNAAEGGTFGVTALQSALGFETYGPELGSGRVSAGLQMDFFGTSQNSPQSASWGSFRLRTATVRVDWARTSLVVGQDTPFISPLSPTSVASLAYPAFFYSGNLWSWIPQARIDHRMRVSERSTVTLQGGIFDPVTRGSRQPAYGTRLAFSHGEEDRLLTVGVAGFYGRQDHGFGRNVDSWTGSTDWLVPLGSRFEVSGELFRGRALGTLGATQNRSVIFNGLETDPLSEVAGLNTVGGWAQLRFKVSSSLEFNAAQGEDRPYRRDLLRFVPPDGSSTAISKNKTGMINMIYRPRTDLLFSMEYRRLSTLRGSAPKEIANHFNLGVGVLF